MEDERKEVKPASIMARHYQGPDLEPGEPIWIPESKEKGRSKHNLEFRPRDLVQMERRKYLKLQISDEETWLYAIKQIQPDRVLLKRLTPKSPEAKDAQRHPEKVLVLSNP